MKIKRRKDEDGILKRYIKSFFHAIDGVVYAIENEHNMILMMIATILVLFVSFILPVTLVEFMIMLILISMVMACEMINSAIEATIDLITLKEHPLAKVAKDLSAAASLILCLSSLICAVIIFAPKIIEAFTGA